MSMNEEDVKKYYEESADGDLQLIPEDVGERLEALVPEKEAFLTRVGRDLNGHRFLPEKQSDEDFAEENDEAVTWHVQAYRMPTNETLTPQDWYLSPEGPLATYDTYEEAIFVRRLLQTFDEVLFDEDEDVIVDVVARTPEEERDA